MRYCTILLESNSLLAWIVIPTSMAEILGLSEEQYIMWQKLDLAQYSVWIDCPQ